MPNQLTVAVDDMSAIVSFAVVVDHQRKYNVIILCQTREYEPYSAA